MNPQYNSAFCQEPVDFFNARHSQLQKYLFWQVRSQEIAEDLAQEAYPAHRAGLFEIRILKRQ